MLQMDSSAHPIVVGGTYLGLEGAAPERVIRSSIGACRLGLVDALRSAEDAAAAAEPLSLVGDALAPQLG